VWGVCVFVLPALLYTSSPLLFLTREGGERGWKEEGEEVGWKEEGEGRGWKEEGEERERYGGEGEERETRRCVGQYLLGTMGEEKISSFC
jgi:hypothetical protein